MTLTTVDSSLSEALKHLDQTLSKTMKFGLVFEGD